MNEYDIASMEFILGSIGLLMLCVVFGAMGLMEAYKPYDEESEND